MQERIREWVCLLDFVGHHGSPHEGSSKRLSSVAINQPNAMKFDQRFFMGGEGIHNLLQFRFHPRKHNVLSGLHLIVVSLGTLSKLRPEVLHASL